MFRWTRCLCQPESLARLRAVSTRLIRPEHADCYPFLLPVTDAGGLLAYTAKAPQLHRAAAGGTSTGY